ncbi:tRNA (adenosine(37)-N6)-threonylcarbamoyltransferase complex transferase subunit TsaD [bacterium]|nr:tRNA (adenosine(37)-N6)-threonylcarbamoyltransferase complex transferase subunit TsaD [bacterium]MBT4648938.1 tRNA (adenosine(37)-N6)-threonylcarbamoyltransferase complex transferase subunit TsaD [bacterium]
MFMRILALESSCDETALTILNAQADSLVLEKDQVYSQVDIHQQFGGVVPEVAARQHAETIIPLLSANIKSEEKVDYLAVTTGPGLITSLLLGVTAAKTLAYAKNTPLVTVNHMEGHIYSNWLSNDELVKNANKYFPSLVLIVSGGHTELVLMKGHGDYQLLGSTVDDAVGEAFDKVAKLLDLGYPGGPIVSQRANDGDCSIYDLPRPMINSGDYNFSFSGLKTAVLYTLERKKKINTEDVDNVCASFQNAVVDILVNKTMKAAQEFGVKSIMLAGGVAANNQLKESLQQEARIKDLPFFFPELKYSGDNAAMISVAAYYNILNKKNIISGKDLLSVAPQSNWQLFKK